MKILAEIFLDFRLVENGLFHAMAERAFIHLEKKKYTLFASCAGDFEFFGQVAKGLFEKELVWISRR